MLLDQRCLAVEGDGVEIQVEGVAPFQAQPADFVQPAPHQRRVGGRVDAAAVLGQEGTFGDDVEPGPQAQAGVEDRVKFLCEDATKTDISEATVLAIYLLPESNELLRPRFDAQLRPGARVVCHNYDIPSWKDKELDSTTVKDELGNEHTIFLYRR